MTSSYMPAVTVEIAFNATYSTPEASRTWTDISDYVEGEIAIQVGRTDEQSVADANTLRLVLDNRDGRFTPKKTTSPYYPDVKVGKAIRVRAQRVGAPSPDTRFVGYIDEWSPMWDGSDGAALAAISASSAMSRLGLSAPLRSVPECEILGLEPVAYYTLGEESGASSATDTSGHGNPRLVQTGTGTAVGFGGATGPPTDGLTATSFAGGKWLQCDLDSFVNGADQSIVLAFSATDVIAASTLALVGPRGTALQSNSVLNGLDISMEADGRLTAHWADTSPELNSSTTVGTFDDGLTHVAILVRNSSGADSVKLYVDGDLKLNVATAGTVNIHGGVLQVGMGLVGALSHVAIFNTALSATDVDNITDALTDGFAGETLQNRLYRYARYGGIDTTNCDFPGTASYPVTHVDTTGRTALEMLRQMEESFGGVLLDKAVSAQGYLQYMDRSWRYQAPVELNLSFTAHEIGDSYAPQMDRSRLLNQVTASSTTANGPVTVARKLTSLADHGPHSVELSIASDDREEIHAAAWWRANTYSDPEPRVSTLTIALQELDPSAQQNLILAFSLGQVVGLINLPSQAASTTATYFIEGWTETIGLETYAIDYNVSPGDLWLNVWVLDQSTLGTGSPTTRLAY